MVIAHRRTCRIVQPPVGLDRCHPMFPLQLSVKSSRVATCLLVAVHGCAWLALFQADLHPVLAGSVAAWVAISLLTSLSRHNPTKNEQALRQIVIAPQHCVLCYGGKQGETQLQTLPPMARYVSEWLLVLQFEALRHVASDTAPATRIKVYLWPDTLSEDDDRKLRVYLRFAAPELEV